MLEIKKFSKFIVGNWKMNGSINSISNYLNDLSKIQIFNSSYCCIICFPYPYVHYFLNNKGNFFPGAQDCSVFLEGAKTGEVSASMLKDLDCLFCIVGHSERRMTFQESNKDISIKAYNAINNGIVPIICIGETLIEKNNQQTKEVLSAQIQQSLPKNANSNNVIIAYEPIWAIGTGLTPAIKEINEIHEFIKNELNNKEDFKVIYGGSVKSNNSKEIMKIHNVDGVLVGGASMDSKEFESIISH